jgi:hypothetical protein
MNLEKWRSNSVFKDPKSESCHGRITISLAAGSAGLGDPVISEEGRAFFLEQMERLSPEHVRAIFTAARPDKARKSAPALDAWMAAFQEKVEQIKAQHCQPAS